MKSQIKRFSKSTLSVILSICMLVSCVTAGIIATGAAVDNSEAVGVSTSDYINGNFDGSWKAYYFNDNGDAFFEKTSSSNRSFGFQVGSNYCKKQSYSSAIVTDLNTEYSAHYKANSGEDCSFQLAAGTYKVHANGSFSDWITYQFSSVTQFPANTKFYLKTSDDWESNSARFAAFFCNSAKSGESAQWVSATKCPGDDKYYYVTSPQDSKYTTLIWVRLNGANNTNSWDNKWNQTGDLAYESGKYMTEISGWDSYTQTSNTHTHTITITGKGRNYAGATISNLTSANSTGTPDWTSVSTYNPADYKVSTAPSGYTYTGMYTDAACTTAAGTSISNTGDATYYALYTHNQVTVNFKNASGTGGTVSQGGTQKISSLTTSNQAVSADYNRSLSYTIVPASGKKITAVSGGGTWNIATGGTSATCTFSATTTTNVTVTQADAGTCGFTLNKSSATLTIGGTTTFTATPNSYHTSSGTISASSSNTSVATVSKSGNTYTVTAVSHGNATITVSCTEGGSATFSVTVSTPTVSIALGQTTLNIGETTTITPTVTNQGTASISYTSSNTSVATISGTTITARAPGTTKIKATVDGVNSSEITLTVNTPQFELSYSPSSIYTGGITSSPTVSIKSGTANASSTKASLSYSITSGSTSGTIDSSTGIVTSGSTAGTVTAKVTGTISYNGVSYTSAQGTANITVVALPSVFFDVVTAESNWGDTNYGGTMTYDASATATVGGTAQIFKVVTNADLSRATDYYIRVWDATNSKNYRPKSVITSEQLLTGSGVEGEENTTPKKITTGSTGRYTFYYDYVNHTFYVEYPAVVKYNVTCAAASNGTVSVDKNQAEKDETVTITLSPLDGYELGTLTVKDASNNDVTVTNNQFTMPASNVTVTATFTPKTNMNLYIAGRFRVRPSSGSTSWTTTYASGSDWNATSTNIPFVYDSGTTYKVETYASLAELSAQIGSSSYTGDPVFFVYDTTNNKNWYASTATTMSTTGVTLTSSGGANSNLKFSSSSTDIPVTIFYNTNNHKIWYSVPRFYDVTLPAQLTGGSVSADITRATANATITLTVTPELGYKLNSISVNPDNIAGPIQLTQNGNQYTFSMPADDVTVSASFSAITYNNITYSARGSQSADATTDFSDTTYAVNLPAGTSNPSSGTYVNGISITAPSHSGYTFYKWVATGGTFTKGGADVLESSNASTTFYPKGNGATLKALYRYDYSLSITTPSHGEVTGTTTGYKAGDSYTLTITPASGYMLDTLTIANTDVTESANITTTGYTYTGTACGASSSITVNAQFKEIEDTVIRVNKYIYNQNFKNQNPAVHLNGIHIWTKINGNVVPLTHYPTSQDPSYENFTEWQEDPNYPDYYVHSYSVHWGKIQLLFHNNGDSNKTNDSAEMATGYEYFVDDLSSNTPVVTRGKPKYSIAGETGLAGGSNNWDTTIVDNEMTANNDGTFSLTRTGIAKSQNIDKGEGHNPRYADYYEFKVVTDHNWNYGAHPASNQQIHVLYNNSTVQFTYDPSHSDTLTATVSGGTYAVNTSTTYGASYISSTDSTVNTTATSVTLNGENTYNDTNYNNNYTTHTVYVKADPIDHFEVTGWVDGNGNTLTPSSVVSVTGDIDTKIATFSVTTDITIVPTIARKQHTVTVNKTPASGGGTVVPSADIVGENLSYSVTVTPATGYKISVFTITGSNGTTDCLNGRTETEKRSGFTIQRTMSNADETVSVTFVMIGYTLSYNIYPSTPAHGTIKFYGDNNGSPNIAGGEIHKANYQDIIYAVYEANDDYKLMYFQPVGGSGTTHKSDDEDDRTNNYGKFQMGAADTTINAYLMLQYDVKYYIDVHSTDMNNKNVNVAIVDSGGTTLQDRNGNDCQGNLAARESGTNVYSGTITTPFDTGSGTIGDIYLKVTYNNSSYTKTIPAAKAAALKNKATKEVWLETKNESSQDLKYTNLTNTTPTVTAGYRRIYLAKPTSRTEADWVNIRIYYWSDNNINNGWDGDSLETDHFIWLGQDASYHYYYVDIPKTDGQNNDKSKYDKFVLQGCGNDRNNWSLKKQSDDVLGIADSDNFFELAASGRGVTTRDSVEIPGYTDYRSEAKMNVDVYSTFEQQSEIVTIKPTCTGGGITYTSFDNDDNTKNTVVTVDENGKLTPLKSGNATVTVRIFGTVGALLHDYNSNSTADSITYDVSVTVKDPGKLETIDIMSIESAVYAVSIPTVSSQQPGYFDFSTGSGMEFTVTGTQGAASSTKSAIITTTDSTAVSNVGTVPIEFTVKYAKANTDFSNYSNISVTGTIVTKSIRYSGANRYGFDRWNPSVQNSSTSVKIKDGVETATTKDFLFNNAVSNYQAIFKTYTYVDVTFNFDYYEYVPEVDENGMINYPYSTTWAGTEDRFDPSFNTNSLHHSLTQYTVPAYEVRGVVKSDLYNENDEIDSEKLSILVQGATAAMGVMPRNNYYTYSIDDSSNVIPKNDIGEVTDDHNAINAYAVTVDVHMKHKPQTYSVFNNGTPVNNGSATGGKYYYQEYAEATANTASKWYAVDNSDPTASIANSPVLATGTGYKFRVKGNTYLRTVAGTIDETDFNRSEVDFSHYEVIHKDKTENETTVTVDYLLQNFYIADFFSPDKVYATRPVVGSDTEEEYKPEEAQFVGGGVVYYSVDNEGNPRSNNAVALGYVNDDGTINENAIKRMLKSNIEANYSENIANEIGKDDAMKIAYGTEIIAQQHTEDGGMKSGVLYRYLPLNQYKRDSNGVLEKDENDQYTFAYDINTNTFRYSNTLQSYQYVYASGNENKETNNGRNMRLYSYYVYSYVAYDQETNVPVTKYDIKISQNYSDASTYWNGNISITLTNSANWNGDIYCYAMDENGQTVVYPGYKMTRQGETNRYSVSIPASTKYVKFSNGTSGNLGSNSTGALQVVEGYIYSNNS